MSKNQRARKIADDNVLIKIRRLEQLFEELKDSISQLPDLNAMAIQSLWSTVVLTRIQEDLIDNLTVEPTFALADKVIEAYKERFGTDVPDVSRRPPVINESIGDWIEGMIDAAGPIIDKGSTPAPETPDTEHE